MTSVRASGTALDRAGVGLGGAAILWGVRPEAPRPCRLTKRDLRVLSFLHDFAYASTSVLAALFWGRYGAPARERLKLLHDNGLVDKLRPRLGRHEGSAEWVYRLSALGWRTIVDAGVAADGEDYAPAVLTSIAYVEHDVQVAALVCRLAQHAARRRGTAGPLIDGAPFQIRGPRSGAVDPRREQRAASPSLASDLGANVVRTERAVPGVLKPDATLVGVDGDGRRTAVMIEFDRTRRAAKQLDRLRRYDHFLVSGWRRTRYADLDVEPAVLVVCASERQIPSFVRAADTELTAWIGGAVTQRQSGEHTGREQVGFTSRSRLHAAEWSLFQVPALPPALRSGPTRSINPRIAHLPLDVMFALPGSRL